MKKNIIVCFACMCSVALFICSLCTNVEKTEMTVDGVESLSQSESGGRVVYCRCSKAIIFANKECLASNHGNLCAQGEPGGNFECTIHGANCGG